MSKSAWKNDINKKIGSPPKSGWKNDLPGTIGTIIGTGRNAKMSFATISIILLLITGVILSIVICYNSSLVDGLVKIWGVLLSPISCIIGYVFGKKD